MKRLLRIYGVWTFCQLSRAVITLVNLDVFTLQSVDDFKTAVVMFVIQAETEIFPSVLSLEGSFMAIFQIDFAR
jgi:hypothetical protein